MSPIPITIITGFLGSGKTTIILNLIPQLPTTYKLALLKNEFGDLAVDSELTSSVSISGTRELLNGCICCNLVGQLSDALWELRDEVSPDRIIIETSGSAFPATLAIEINRIAREGDPAFESGKYENEAGETVEGQSRGPGAFVLDGVISVVDVENWKGYEDTSYTAKVQAKYTDLIVFNKWELVGEEGLDRCLDRVGDLDVQTAWVRSANGRVDKDVIMGIDGALVGKGDFQVETNNNHDHGQKQSNGEHDHTHSSEVEVLSVTLTTTSDQDKGIKITEFEDLLLSAPKDEIYRIKGLVSSKSQPPDSTGGRKQSLTPDEMGVYVLNWAFSRWNWTQLGREQVERIGFGVTNETGARDVVRLTFILARGEAKRWKKKIESSGLIQVDGGGADLKVERIA